MKFADRFYFLLIGCNRPILTMFLIYVCYLVIGSLCFVTLETKQEDAFRNSIKANIKLAKDMVNVLRKGNFTDDEIFYTFLRQKEEIMSKSKPDVGWRQMFGDKVFYAFTLISTVGYGNVAVSSTLGQVIVIVYTMFGLPIHVIMMRLISFRFRANLRKVIKIGQKCFPSAKWSLVVFGFLYFAFWFFILIFLPAIFFTKFEDWNYDTAAYFGFVTHTTIGLGDYVAVVDINRYSYLVYSLLVAIMMIWMFLGLGFMFMVLNMLSYLLGKLILDKLDSKCQQRAAARRKMKRLLALMTELNWKLVKSKPINFHDSEEIEDFKLLLTENPQDVTGEQLRRIFDIVIDLKEKAYHQLSGLQLSEIPITSHLQRMKDDLPEAVSKDSADNANSNKTNLLGLTAEDIAKLNKVQSDQRADGISGSSTIVEEEEDSGRSVSGENSKDVNSEKKDEQLEDKDKNEE